MVLRLVFLKKPSKQVDKGTTRFWAIALMSVLAKWYAAVVAMVEWRALHVGI